MSEEREERLHQEVGPSFSRSTQRSLWHERFENAKVEVRSDHSTFDEHDKPSTFIIPASAVRNSILRHEHVEEILECLSLPDGRSLHTRGGLVTRIRDHCLIVFCILLFIGEPQCIERFLLAPEHCDDHLPFLTAKSRPSCLSEDKWTEFLEQQWHFVPYTARRGVTEQQSKLIFPYLNCVPLGNGASSNIWRVRLHQEYDELYTQGKSLDESAVAQSTDDTEPTSPATRKTLVGDKQTHREYALKVYTGVHAVKRYTAETRAFENIKGGKHTQWPVGLIKYHGAYTILGSETRCLLLDLAAGGTLMNMFENIPPPMEASDVRDFWVRLFELIEGMSMLHNLGISDDREIPREAHCVHFDIHPRNIVLTADGTSQQSNHHCFQHKYQLADLGHSSTVIKPNEDEKAEEPQFLDTQAGREYAGPEVCEQVEVEKRFHKYVTAVADVFSLGAVFLVAAVWIVQGPEYVKAFATEREQECRREHDMPARFHTAQGRHSSLLEVVARYFSKDHLTPYIRNNDDMTAQVLEGLIRRMLEPDPGARINAFAAMKETKHLTKRKTRIPTRRHSTPPIVTAGVQNPLYPSNTDDHAPELITPTYRTAVPIQEVSGGENHVDVAASTPVVTISSEASSGLQSNVTQDNAPREGIDSVLSKERYPDHQSLAHRRHQSVIKSSKTTPVTVDDVLEHIAGRSKRRWWKIMREPDELPKAHRIAHIDDGNIMFLIDDSGSMRSKHFDSVIRTFEAMLHVAQTKDKDGVELHYANSKDHLPANRGQVGRAVSSSKKEAQSRAMVEDVKNHQFRGTTDMKHSLGQLLRSCQDSIIARKDKGVGQQIRGTTIIVLTDGLWEAGDAVEQLISETAAFLHDKELDRKTLCISFVSFGKDKLGIGRMCDLDELSEDGKALLDIVDHEHQRGDVIKMVFGARDADMDDADNASG